MFDHLIYLLWLRLSFRWYTYRITGVDPESGIAKVITFATEDLNIESVMAQIKEETKVT